MIKVLLVDDEKLALEYLEHIIDWEYHGFELIGGNDKSRTGTCNLQDTQTGSGDIRCKDAWIKWIGIRGCNSRIWWKYTYSVPFQHIKILIM